MKLYKALHITVLLLATLLWACSVEPDNLEPDLLIEDVYGVTRTEASVKFHVQKHGPVDLKYMILYYGEPGEVVAGLPVSDLAGSYHSMTLEDLRAGTTYECYVEGGTTTATIRSEKIHFTTVPNDIPSVSAPYTLSTGPIGMIVAFDIIDDGGEQMQAAGCQVTDHSTGLTMSFAVPENELTVGSHRFNITGLTTDTRYTITSFASNSIGLTQSQPLDITTINSIVLTDAGTLPLLFEKGSLVEFERLTIAGKMNGDDFRFIRNLVSDDGSTVTELDLTGVDIVSGGDSYDGQRYTEDNVITTGLFSNCLGLKEILLPASATRLDRDALAACTSLKELLIPAGIRTLLPSAGCCALESITVSSANTAYASADGVLFNNAISNILWFPLGKKGYYQLPATVTTIGENAFYGTSITGLVIPESVAKISRGAFAGSALETVTFPNNLTNIPEAIFQNCSSLTTVYLGSHTELIANYAFDGTALKDLFLSATVPPYTMPEAFYNRAFSLFTDCTLYVPQGCKTKYRNHKQWGQFNNIVEF